MMSAIAGVVGLPCREPVIHKLLKTMHHRGPDDSGWTQEQEVTLLHTRLAIRDLQSAAQPMKLDGKTLVYNGELYNARELQM